MLHIEISDDVVPLVEAGMERNGLATPEDYVNKLLRAEEARRAGEELENLLQEGLDSGFVGMEETEWKQWVAEAPQRYEARSRVSQ